MSFSLSLGKLYRNGSQDLSLIVYLDVKGRNNMCLEFHCLGFLEGKCSSSRTHKRALLRAEILHTQGWRAEPRENHVTSLTCVANSQPAAQSSREDGVYTVCSQIEQTTV